MEVSYWLSTEGYTLLYGDTAVAYCIHVCLYRDYQCYLLHNCIMSYYVMLHHCHATVLLFSSMSLLSAFI